MAQVYDLRKRNPSQIVQGMTTEAKEIATGETPVQVLLGDGSPSSPNTANSSLLQDESLLNSPEKEKHTAAEPRQAVKDIPVIKMKDFEIVNLDDKLNLLMSAINKINTNFHIKLDSVKKELLSKTTALQPRISALETLNQELTTRVDDLESKCAGFQDICSRIDKMEQENSKLRDDVAVLKGFVQVQDKAITSNKDKIINLTARSMANNITISGILEEEDENCKDKVLSFLHTYLDLETNPTEVEVAHRLGKK